MIHKLRIGFISLRARSSSHDWIRITQASLDLVFFAGKIEDSLPLVFGGRIYHGEFEEDRHHDLSQ